MTFTIRIKLFGAFSLFLALLVTTSFLSLNKMANMGRMSIEVNTNSIPSISLLSSMNNNIANVDRLAVGMVLEPDSAEKQKLQTKMESYLAELKDKRSEFEKLINTDQEKQLYDDFSKRWSQYEQALPSIIEAAQANNAGAANYHITEARPAFNGADDRLDSLASLALEDASQAGTQSLQT
ncbi:MAG: MCP four helix bundle domain-containing protein, partial [Tumebacillaceae bacterium]